MSAADKVVTGTTGATLVDFIKIPGAVVLTNQSADLTADAGPCLYARSGAIKAVDTSGNITTITGAGATGGNQTVNGNLSVTGTATVTGASFLTGNISAGGTLGVVGIATFNAGTNTAASAPVLTPTLSSGTAAQLADLTRDYSVTMNITTSGTATHIEIGPTNTPANTVLASASVTAGQVISFRLPAGWFIKWTGTTTALSTLAVGC